MVIIPAIDLKGGRCVRLIQGKMDRETVFSDVPTEVAKRWESSGARLIHLVDLDGAIDGSPKNLETIEAITGSIAVDVQVGGGIRNIEVARHYLEGINAKRVVLGTAAYNDKGLLKTLCREFPGRVAVGIDAKEGNVAIRGWVEITEDTAVDLAKRLEDLGVSCIIYTDIARDGTLSGPNIDGIGLMADSVNVPVVASGGISGIEDIEALKGTGAAGVIIGKALYTGAIELSRAIETAKA